MIRIVKYKSITTIPTGYLSSKTPNLQNLNLADKRSYLETALVPALMNASWISPWGSGPFLLIFHNPCIVPNIVAVGCPACFAPAFFRILRFHDFRFFVMTRRFHRISGFPLVLTSSQLILTTPFAVRASWHILPVLRIIDVSPLIPVV
jgi:hypothetical protein